MELCVLYFVFSCYLFFKQLFVTNLTQYFKGIENDIFQKFEGINMI